MDKETFASTCIVNLVNVSSCRAKGKHLLRRNAYYLYFYLFIFVRFLKTQFILLKQQLSPLLINGGPKRIIQRRIMNADTTDANME